MSTKDKIKVIGEEMDETKVARFLEMQPGHAGTDPDFHALLRAYRGLPPEAFEHFLQLFTGQGRNINARDRQGRTLLQQVRTHASHPEYVPLLEKFGAE